MRRVRRGAQLLAPFRGNQLADLRINANMTQRELAEQVKIPRSTYAHIELGTCLPTRGILESICQVLECNVSDVYPKEVLDLL